MSNQMIDSLEGYLDNIAAAKGLPFNDEWNVGTAKTVSLKHPYKENLMYEDSLSCSTTRNAYI